MRVVIVVAGRWWMFRGIGGLAVLEVQRDCRKTPVRAPRAQIFPLPSHAAARLDRAADGRSLHIQVLGRAPHPSSIF
jgi:hypothetical protein